MVVGEHGFEMEELEHVGLPSAVVRVVELALAVLQVGVALLVQALVGGEVHEHVVDLMFG